MSRAAERTVVDSGLSRARGTEVSADDQATILVVDADSDTRAGMERILTAARFRVVSAASAADATRWLVDHEPDAFILAADGDGIDGVGFCQWLRTEGRFRTTPILIATGRDDRYLLRAAFTAGCDDFLLRPLEPLVVVARIGGLMKKAEYFGQLEEIRAELARYVSPRVRHQIEWRVGSRSAAPGPALRDVCILFSDIRGFTALSETVAPEQLFSTVSEHLGMQVDCVYRHHGYVDKFGGDGLMAIFDGETMAVDACACALDIMSRVDTLAHAEGAGTVPLGIGIHAGPVVMGNIGTGDHLDYTAIGETVNIAARLCGHAASARVVVSEAVAGRVGQRADLRFTGPETASIRGLSHPILLYHLEGASAPPATD